MKIGGGKQCGLGLKGLSKEPLVLSTVCLARHNIDLPPQQGRGETTAHSALGEILIKQRLYMLLAGYYPREVPF